MAGLQQNIWTAEKENQKQELISLVRKRRPLPEIYSFISKNFDLQTLRSMYNSKPGEGETSLHKAWRQSFPKQGDMVSAYSERQAKLLGVPVREYEVRQQQAKRALSEYDRASEAFGRLEQELAYRTRNVLRDPGAFLRAQMFEDGRTEGGKEGFLQKAYLEAWQSLLAEDAMLGKKREHTTGEILRRIDFGKVPLDSFMLYLHIAEPDKAAKLLAMLNEASGRRDSAEKFVSQNRLLDVPEIRDRHYDTMSKAYLLSRAFSGMSDYDRFTPGVPRDYPTISEQTGYSRKYNPVIKRPAAGHELLVSQDPWRYMDTSRGGGWVDKQTLEAMQSRKPADYGMVPLVGPIIDAMKKWDEIKTKNGAPAAVRTWDPDTREWKEGKVRLVRLAVHEVWNPNKKDYDTYFSEAPAGRAPAPKKVYDKEKGKWVEGKVKIVDGAEFTTWNPWSKKEEKRLEEKPGAGWTDYAWLTLHITFAALDGVFIMQSALRSSARSMGTRGFIKSGEDVYVRGMTELSRGESVRLLNIAREKRSWDAVLKELRAMAKGGDVTADVMRQYIAKEWGGGAARRAGVRMGKGFKDFFGNLLTPVSRRKYQAKLVAEYFNDLRHSTNFSTARKLAESLRAANLPPQLEKRGVRAIFEAITSFSPKVQKQFLEAVSKPGVWKELLKQMPDSRAGALKALAKLVPEFQKYAGAAQARPLVELAAYMVIVPVATKKPLESLIKWLDKKFEVREADLEKMGYLLDLADMERGFRAARRAGAGE